jgi:predicted negative regulator of RcsB-dependent stress response
VEAYQTEEQQVEAIKKFWSENGNYIIGGLVLGFAGFIGFNYYKDSKLEGEIAVATEYQALMDSQETDHEGFKVKADGFIQANSDSSYASLTALSLAKDAAEHKDWEKTAAHLTKAIDTAPNEGIKAIATVRLARVQTQLADYEAALATIGGNLPDAFKTEVEEIKGDIYLKQGKKELARNAYQAAIDADGLAKNPSLQIKLDDLAQITVLN